VTNCLKCLNVSGSLFIYTMSFTTDYVDVKGDSSENDRCITSSQTYNYTLPHLVLHVNLKHQNTGCYVLYDWYRSSYLIRFEYDEYTTAVDYSCETAKQAAAFIKLFNSCEETVLQLCSCVKMPYDVHDVTYESLEEDDECYCYGKLVYSNKQSCLVKFIKILSTMYN
jgi:hypothetical protein